MSKKNPGYETVIVTRVDMTDDALKTLKDKINGIIGAYKGEVIYQEDWGKRKLAYPIEKETRAQYSYVVYTGTSDVVAEVERNLRLNEFVVRFMTVVLAKEFDKELYTKENPNGTPLKREERAPNADGIVAPAAIIA
jgi:small subunit ribosomal protein S6